MALTPMVLTGRMTKKQHPDCKVVFIGPCAAKKLEASRKSVRSDIDFVLTFEEMMGIFDAKNIEFDKLEVEEAKTKVMAKALTDLKVEGKALIILADRNDNVLRSSRNIEGVKTIELNTINVFDLLNCNKLVLPLDTVKKLEEVYA